MSDTISGNPLLFGFSPSLFEFEVRVTNLGVRRNWTTNTFFLEDSDSDWDSLTAERQDRIFGVGDLGRNHLEFIGGDASPAGSKLEVVISSYRDVAQLIDRRDRIQRNWAHNALEKFEKAALDDDSRQILKFLSHQYGRFEKQPSTLSLGYLSSMPEYKVTEHWYLTCDFPETVFADLARELDFGALPTLTIKIHTIPSLVKEWYADWDDHHTIGLLQAGDRTQSTRGWVTEISWGAESARPTRDYSLKAPTSPEPVAPQVTLQEQLRQAFASADARAVQATWTQFSNFSFLLIVIGVALVGWGLAWTGWIPHGLIGALLALGGVAAVGLGIIGIRDSERAQKP